MSVDISKIRPGDKVTLVPLEVVNKFENAINVAFPSRTGAAVWVNITHVAAHHPAPREFQVGQQVLKMGDIYGAAVTGPWVVVGIHKERVWLSSPEGERERYVQVSRDELKHMDGTAVEP